MKRKYVLLKSLLLVLLLASAIALFFVNLSGKTKYKDPIFGFSFKYPKSLSILSQPGFCDTSSPMYEEGAKCLKSSKIKLSSADGQENFLVIVMQFDDLDKPFLEYYESEIPSKYDLSAEKRIIEESPIGLKIPQNGYENAYEIDQVNGNKVKKQLDFFKPSMGFSYIYRFYRGTTLYQISAWKESDTVPQEAWLNYDFSKIDKNTKKQFLKIDQLMSSFRLN